MTPHNHTIPPANAHHEADKGQNEPLTAHADTPQADNLTSAELEELEDIGEVGEFFATFIELLHTEIVKNGSAKDYASKIVGKIVSKISQAFTGETFYVSRKPAIFARQLAIYADTQTMPHYLVDKKYRVSKGYSLKVARQIKAILNQNNQQEQLAMTPHNHTIPPANAHHEADKGQNEPLTAHADTPPATGKVIAEQMQAHITALHDSLTSLAHHATDLAKEFPTMTTADFDVSISGLIGELWDSVHQAETLLPMPAEIYIQTLEVDFVSITEKAKQRLFDDLQATETATGDI